jgi:uncharacterized protein
MKRFFSILAGLWCACAAVWSAEVIPPAPARYFNDYANVVSPGTASQLNQTLEDFERSNSSQILVAVFPKMQSDSSIEDYTVRVAQSWRAGQKAKDNGAVLFVFIQDRKLQMQVGYGLEGALPDALCKRIIENEITPRFKAGDYSGGLSAGVTAIVAAAKGEYKGSGRTVADKRQASKDIVVFGLAAIIIGGFFLFGLFRPLFAGGFVLNGRSYSNRGSNWPGGGFGGGGSGGGGGGFSGGGGSFGGGGAGGSW